MSRIIEISDSTGSRLQSLMSSDDTYESVIARLIDSHLGRTTERTSTSRTNGRQSNALEFRGFEIPNLTHARLLRASVAGVEVPRPNWNKLRQAAIVRAAKEGADIKKWSIPGMETGRKTIHGYSFIPDINISIQGQDANDAWRSTLEIAQRMGWNVEAVCEWRRKAGASYPGETATLFSDTPRP